MSIKDGVLIHLGVAVDPLNPFAVGLTYSSLVILESNEPNKSKAYSIMILALHVSSETILLAK